MFKTIIRNSILAILAIYLLGSFVVFHVDCWSQRDRHFLGTVVGINNSMGKYSSTCLMEVNWDGIGTQIINAGSMGCLDFKVGDRIGIARGWNPITGKDGTAYIPEDPKLISDNWLIIMGAMITEFIIVVAIFIGMGYLVTYLFT